MAIANTFTFGGVSTATYGVTVEGSGDYSGAKRAVEMISIPGRNGAFALDKGYFENEPVEYDVLIQGATQATFETSVASFRNAILSKTGYQRLTDTYHPNEYRMAVYVGGFDEEPTFHGKGASFKVKFDCKPQRFLTSGESAVSVASGDTLTNPTLFESSPLLAVEGYGTIDVNGTEIEIADELVGDVTAKTHIDEYRNTYSVIFPDVYINTGDQIQVNNAVIVLPYRRRISNKQISSRTNISTSGDGTVNYTSQNSTSFTLTASFTNPLTFTYGTEATKEILHSFKLTFSDSSILSLSFKFQVIYDGNKTITLYTPANNKGYFEPYSVHITSDEITIHSTATTFGHPTYIDCDLGEAYASDNGVISSLNSYIALGSKLPVLSPGSNTITYDNTITSLKVTPRWWKV